MWKTISCSDAGILWSEVALTSESIATFLPQNASLIMSSNTFKDRNVATDVEVKATTSPPCVCILAKKAAQVASFAAVVAFLFLKQSSKKPRVARRTCPEKKEGILLHTINQYIQLWTVFNVRQMYPFNPIFPNIDLRGLPLGEARCALAQVNTKCFACIQGNNSLNDYIDATKPRLSAIP